MNLQKTLEEAWFKQSPWLVFFIPLSWLYAVIVILRRKCYDWGIFKRYAFETPVIVVGNILVGGTGKTPFVIALVEYLQNKGLKIGVVSRGYKAKCQQFPHKITERDEAAFVGDEPCLIHQKTNCITVIDPDRPRGIQWLIDHHKPDVIICDDGLQHYALKPGYSIVLQPKNLGFNPYCLPAGPLREPLCRLQHFDLIVDQVDITLESLDLDPSWRYNLITAIARPERVHERVAEMGVDAEPLVFPDHHAFTAEDFINISGPIIMTEKDWVKCKDLMISQSVYILRLTATLPEKVKSEINHYLGIDP
jgi:tetraacyldisaccharide 4'-kinase